MKYVARTGSEEFEVQFVETRSGLTLVDGERELPVEILPGDGPIRQFRIGDRTISFGSQRVGNTFRIVLDGVEHVVDVMDARLKELADRGVAVGGSQTRADEVVAPIPGRIVRVLVEPGQEVIAGEVLVVLDAMKLENEIQSPGPGTVSTLEVSPGEAVEKGQVMVRFES